MRIGYLHASKYGNGAMVVRAIDRRPGCEVEVHHIREVTPSELPSADLYVFSSPGRFGRLIGHMCRFLKRVALSSGTPYAILTTEAAPN